MPHTCEIPNGNGVQIKVGTTGTVSSLMSRELESIKESARASPPSRKKLQDPPVSVPCGYSPKRSQLRRNSPADPGSSSSSGGDSGSSNPGSQSPADPQKPRSKLKPRRAEHKSPMLATAEPTLEKNTSKDKPEKKKERTYIAEVVDLKCNNPMSSRLKKLGFSKLSESVI